MSKLYIFSLIALVIMVVMPTTVGLVSVSDQVVWAQQSDGSSADDDGPTGESTEEAEEATGGGGTDFQIDSPIDTTLPGLIGTIINFAFSLAGLVALGYLIYGGYSYIASSGNPEAVEGAKNIITNAIVGLIIVLVSYLVVEFLLDRLGAAHWISL